MDTKQCSKCREVKELEEFSRMTASPDGRQGYCKQCAKAYHQGGHDGALAKKKQLLKEGKMRCTKCSRILPATAEHFRRGKDYLGGLRAVCRECNARNARGNYAQRSNPHRDETYCFYTVTDLDLGRVIYVGRTKRELSFRTNQHVRNRNYPQIPLHTYLASKDPSRFVFEEVARGDDPTLERDLIKQYGTHITGLNVEAVEHREFIESRLGIAFPPASG